VIAGLHGDVLAYQRAKAWCDRVLGGLLSLFGAYFVIVAPS
jgi:hypothetical protein